MISGKKFDIDPPARAPTKLAKTRADEEPKNTARGLLDVPLIVNVAICVFYRFINDDHKYIFSL